MSLQVIQKKAYVFLLSLAMWHKDKRRNSTDKRRDADVDTVPSEAHLSNQTCVTDPVQAKINVSVVFTISTGHLS